MSPRCARCVLTNFDRINFGCKLTVRLILVVVEHCGPVEQVAEYTAFTVVLTTILVVVCPVDQTSVPLWQPLAVRVTLAPSTGVSIEAAKDRLGVGLTITVVLAVAEFTSSLQVTE